MTSPVAVLVAEHLSKHYGNNRAVDDVAFEIQPGEVFGVLGPNGAGKTTTLEMMVGLRIPSAGSVRVLGLDPCRQRDDLVKHIGIQPQQASIFPHLRVWETLKLFGSFHAAPLPCDDVLAMVELQEQRNDLVKRLSGGQRQRLLIGLALVSQPQLLFLDEPTGSLDPHARRQLWEVIQAQRGSGRTVILTTHYMEEAELLCDRVAIMNHGKVLAVDSPQNLIREHFPERMVDFETSHSVSDDSLRALPGVTKLSVTRKGMVAQVRCYSLDPDATLRSLVLNATALPTKDLRVEQATLEDVFLRLTTATVQAPQRRGDLS